MSVLLQAVTNCKSERELGQIHDLIKDTRVTKETVNTAVEKAKSQGFAIGSKVMFYNDKTDIGEVVAFNTSTMGFGTGDRYPVIVKFERGTFEYGTDCLTILGD